MTDVERNYEDVLVRNAARKMGISSKQKALADKFKQDMLNYAMTTAKHA